MPFIQPALASPFPGDLPEGEWIAEEKFDGHRLVVEVFDGGGTASVTGWSRNGIVRVLPQHLRDAMKDLPNGLYDGELLAAVGGRSYDVSNLSNQEQLRYVLFDLLELDGESMADVPYWQRRNDLLLCAPALDEAAACSLGTSWSQPVETMEEVFVRAGQVWDRDGEGLILKEMQSLYKPGKRLKQWLKIKKTQSVVMSVLGFTEGLKGPHSIFVLQDDDGTITSCKWKNYEELAAIDASPQSYIGRRCLVDFHERTTDGQYRHPRFDRWEDE